MAGDASFGYWVRRRRKALDLTQEELARRVGCAETTIRKIEVDARRPSRQIAERLAEQLELPEDLRAAFVQAARAELAADRLTLPLLPAPQPPPAPRHSDWETPAASLPSGTVTFLCTDIEDSTRLWERHPDIMGVAGERHATILRATISAHHGIVFKRGGDGVYAVFTRAPDALAAAVAAQQALRAEAGGEAGLPRARMVLHSGVAEARDGDYYGPSLNHAAQLLLVGHGGQILLSQATAELVHDHLPADVELRTLGRYRLKDLSRAEELFEVLSPDLPRAFPPLRARAEWPHSLPAPTTRLIGREREVAHVSALLRRADVRLVTLRGPGGVGKTRLALATAANVLDDFPSGVFFVSLEPASSVEDVAMTLAQTLGMPVSDNEAPLNSLKDKLRGIHTLLVLDNFEHVLPAAALVSDILKTTSTVKLLVTSREALHLSGEVEVTVAPLALPDDKQLPALDLLSSYAAIQLFTERAQAVKPDFTLTQEYAASVAKICQHLDGLPLAIELAAARVKLFTPNALLARLTQRWKLLSAGMRDLPVRQQTLRNTIDWSYNLLSAEEQKLFARVSVFVNGCTIEAAEAICNLDGDLEYDMLTGLAALADKSMVWVVEGLTGDPRFGMLETLRMYARERLAERGETAALRQRHANYFLAYLEHAYTPWSHRRLFGKPQHQEEQGISTSQPSYVTNAQDPDRANLHAAMAWLIQRSPKWIAKWHTDEN
jgi:predicted ATPase/class 3 adenylate cyclase